MAAAITNGVQRHPHCGTTIKHYCVNNQETNRFNSNSIVSERALREIYLKGFGICIRRSQPLALMTSYNLLNGVHTSESRDLIENVLRCDFGYQGMVMTDWVIAGMADKTSAHRGAVADEIVASGNDIVMPGSKQDDENIRKALSDGRLDREQLEANASRLLKIARKLTAE
jgi:beta-glucosidase